MNKFLARKLIPSFLIIAFAIFMIIITPTQVRQIGKLSTGPRALPYLCCGGLILLNAVQIIKDIVSYIREKEFAHDTLKINKVGILKVVGVSICILLWIIAVPNIGYVLSTFLITGATMWIMGYRNIIFMLGTMAVTAISCKLIFVELLSIPI